MPDSLTLEPVLWIDEAKSRAIAIAVTLESGANCVLQATLETLCQLGVAFKAHNQTATQLEQKESFPVVDANANMKSLDHVVTSVLLIHSI